jgi:signal transduction histidine kinase
MPIRLNARTVPDGIPRGIASCLYRIAQEALHNVAKHAGDTTVRVTLARTDDDDLQLVIQDEGHGFDIAQARLGDGLGLVSMQERVRLLGGIFSIRSQPGEGTSIEVMIPLLTGSEP